MTAVEGPGDTNSRLPNTGAPGGIAGKDLAEKPVREERKWRQSATQLAAAGGALPIGGPAGRRDPSSSYESPARRLEQLRPPRPTQLKPPQLPAQLTRRWVSVPPWLLEAGPWMLAGGAVAGPFILAGMAKQDYNARLNAVMTATHWPESEALAYLLGWDQRNGSDAERHLAGLAVRDLALKNPWLLTASNMQPKNIAAAVAIDDAIDAALRPTRAPLSFTDAPRPETIAVKEPDQPVVFPRVPPPHRAEDAHLVLTMMVQGASDAEITRELENQRTASPEAVKAEGAAPKSPRIAEAEDFPDEHHFYLVLHPLDVDSIAQGIMRDFPNANLAYKVTNAGGQDIAMLWSPDEFTPGGFAIPVQRTDLTKYPASIRLNMTRPPHPELDVITGHHRLHWAIPEVLAWRRERIDAGRDPVTEFITLLPHGSR
jgi:hypothetical protein